MLAMGDAVALTMVTKTASEAHGHLTISVVGLTWAPRVLRQFTHRSSRSFCPAIKLTSFST
jgi:hypothetical protein